MADEERWEEYPEIPYFEISDQGNVRSWDTKEPVHIYPSGNYRGFGFSSRTAIRVAAGVLETFVGPRPPGYCACHKNDIPDDDRLENLYWGSRRENQLDALRNGNKLGGRPPGFNHSEETKKKIGEKRRARPPASEYTRLLTSMSMTSRPVSEEAKKKISEAAKLRWARKREENSAKH